MNSYVFLRKLGDGSTYHLGTAVYYPNGPGWRFLSNVTSHKSSRKFHPTMEACVPRWARHDSVEVVKTAERVKA